MDENFQAILENTSLFKYIYENARDNAIQVMDSDGYILHINQAFENAFGYTIADLQGKHSRVLFTAEDQKKLKPEMEIAEVNQQGSSVDHNYIVHKDGSCIWVAGESMFTKDENGKIFIIKFINDIHEQKLLEKFLKESQEFSEKVVKSINDALVVIDPDGKVLKVNNSFYNLFEISEETIEGLQVAEINDPYWSSEAFQQGLIAFFETGSFEEQELERPSKEGATKYLSVKARFLDGEMVGKKALFIIADVTDKVLSEQHRDDLIGFVIHELRNPLANITLCTELLEQSILENDKESTEVFLNKTKSNTARLNSLIRELFEATKIGSGNLQFVKSVFNFEELVQEAIDTVQLTYSSHKIKKEGTANVEVSADRSRLLQVITNYLINAIKYSPKANKVNVHIAVEEGNIIVAVTDFGQGIPKDKIANIFNRYYRADKALKTEGLGLGLFLCKQIITAHNGRVWVESKVNEGSTFYFSIPL